MNFISDTSSVSAWVKPDREIYLFRRFDQLLLLIPKDEGEGTHISALKEAHPLGLGLECVERTSQ